MPRPELVETQEFVGFVGLGDASGAADDAGYASVALEQAGLGA